MTERITDLVLTGDRLGGRYGIALAGQPAWLSLASFRALLALAGARLSSDDDFAHLPATTVWRLRQEIAKIIGAKQAHQLIVSGEGGTYALALDKTSIVT